jgi:hypothetical protein
MVEPNAEATKVAAVANETLTIRPAIFCSFKTLKIETK